MRTYIVFILLMLLFRFTLDIGYIYYVHPTFVDHFLGMRYEFDFYQYLSSWLVYSAMLPLLNHRHSSVGNIVYLIGIVFVIAPLTSQYGLDAERAFLPVLYTVISLVIVKTVSALPLSVRKIPVVNNRSKYVVYVAYGAIGYLLIWSVLSGAIAHINFNPELVYDFRINSSSVLDKGFLGYLNLWTYKFFTIFLVCHYLDIRNFKMVMFIILIQTYFYGLTSQKTVFALPFLAIAFWYFLSKNAYLYKVPLLLSFVIMAVLGHFLYTDDGTLATAIIRRTFYVPSALTFEWFEYFSTHSFIYWTDRLMAPFISSEYNGLKIPFIMGDWLYYNKLLSANNGMVSAGYSHAGILGVALYATILGLLVNLANRYANSSVPMWMVIALTVGPIKTALVDSDLLTAILSHGIFISLLIITFYQSPNLNQSRGRA